MQKILWQWHSFSGTRSKRKNYSTLVTKEYERRLKTDSNNVKYVLINKEKFEITGLENDEEYQYHLTTKEEN